LKNASIPVFTYGALIFVGLFLVGSVVAETIFTWPGVGRLIILQSVRHRDFPVVQAAVIFICFLYVTVNLLVDILYSYLDPRIRRP
jgi:peptide/nickel transport system permease protein